MPVSTPPEPKQEPAPQFDPVAFKTEIMTEVNKAFNAIDKRVNALKKEPPAPEPGEPQPAADPTAKIDPAVNAELQLLRKQLQTVTNTVKETEKQRDDERRARLETERVTAIRNVLGGIEFRDQESRDLVFSAVANQIKRDEAGTLIAETKDGPVSHDAYIKSFAEKYPYLLAPHTTGGAGASGGKPVVGGKRWSMEDLTPSRINALKPDEQAALLKSIMAGEVR